MGDHHDILACPAPKAMRTLLIDNYDSFTFNLFQLLAEVNGREPLVVRNDEARWDELAAMDFDNVVLSPGPGHPANRRDFGVCAEAIARCEKPLLGVCLGHQGLGLAAGAEVVPAPVPVHGRRSRIEHSGAPLFAGIPRHFEAVRYHSLCLQRPLPPDLEEIATAEDGVPMAIAHRDRPHWGVQFHPESIASEQGRRLLENFRDLSAPESAGSPSRGSSFPHSGQKAPQPGAARAERGRMGASAGPLRLAWQRLSLRLDPEVAFISLYGESDDAFWLDGNPPGQRSRFSFLGDASGPLAAVVTHDVDAGELIVRRGDGKTETHEENLFTWLDRELARLRLPEADVADLPFDFQCGFAGYLGYELKAECGADRAHGSPHPDATLIFADRLLAFDHAQGDVYLLHLHGEGGEERNRERQGEGEREDQGVGGSEKQGNGGRAGTAGSAGGNPSHRAPATQEAAQRWISTTTRRLEELANASAGGAAATGSPEPPRCCDADPVAAAPPTETLRTARPRDHYLADVQSCHRHLVAGDSYELCLTNRVEFDHDGDPLDLYRQLRRANPAPYSAYLGVGNLAVLSSSPERFLRIEAEGGVEARPIKGTCRRSPDPAEDRRLAADLAASEKNRAENLMIADLMRNDLGSVCEVGSVTVPALMEVESYETVHQLVTTVRGRRREDVGPAECVRACFPPGSMTGAPKRRAMEILDGLEGAPRGVYSGAIGYFGLGGGCDLSVAIRTIVLADGRGSVGAGGAIVLDSDPEGEYEEMLLKAAAPLRALDPQLEPASISLTEPRPAAV
ncbi:MAG: aminodeoxychorismate synthase component I [Solirubrobacterales bacterium]